MYQAPKLLLPGLGQMSLACETIDCWSARRMMQSKPNPTSGTAQRITI